MRSRANVITATVDCAQAATARVVRGIATESLGIKVAPLC